MADEDRPGRAVRGRPGRPVRRRLWRARRGRRGRDDHRRLDERLQCRGQRRRSACLDGLGVQRGHGGMDPLHLRGAEEDRRHRARGSGSSWGVPEFRFSDGGANINGGTAVPAGAPVGTEYPVGTSRALYTLPAPRTTTYVEVRIASGGSGIRGLYEVWIYEDLDDLAETSRVWLNFGQPAVTDLGIVLWANRSPNLYPANSGVPITKAATVTLPAAADLGPRHRPRGNVEVAIRSVRGDLPRGPPAGPGRRRAGRDRRLRGEQRRDDARDARGRAGAGLHRPVRRHRLGPLPDSGHRPQGDGRDHPLGQLRQGQDRGRLPLRLLPGEPAQGRRLDRRRGGRVLGPRRPRQHRLPRARLGLSAGLAGGDRDDPRVHRRDRRLHLRRAAHRGQGPRRDPAADLGLHAQPATPTTRPGPTRSR